MDDEQLDDAVVHRVADVLDDGPASLESLVAHLDREGAIAHWPERHPEDLIDRLDELLTHYDGFWSTADGHAALTEWLVEDIVLTHRLDADELATGMVAIHPDLCVLGVDRTVPLDLVGGGLLEPMFGDLDEDAEEGADEDADEGVVDSGSLLGPSGWLGAFEPGALVAFVRDGDQVAVVPAAELGDPAPVVAALRRCFGALVPRAGYGTWLAGVVLDTIVADGDSFLAALDPLPPMSELLDAAGLESRGEWVGPVDAEWQPPYLAGADDELAMLAERYELDDCCLDLLDAVMDAWNELVVSASVAVQPWPEVARALEHGFVAPAFADHVLVGGDETLTTVRFDAFVAALTDAGRRGGAPAAYLAARGLERRGDVLAAETSLRASLRADPHYLPALEHLASFAADRGDVEQALNLLRRSAAPADDPEVVLLEALRPSRNAVGRNERCPCGSGRKYKDCCSGRTTLTAAQRGDWLLHRLWSFVLRPDHQHRPLALTAMIAGDDADVFDALLDAGVPMDLAAFEGGLAAEYLVERGPLLDDVDRDLLRTWIDARRKLWRVHEVSADAIELRSAAADQTEQSASLPSDAMRDIAAGDLVLARVAPEGDRERVVGVWIEVHPDEGVVVPQLVTEDADDVAFARWLGHRA